MGLSEDIPCPFDQLRTFFSEVLFLSDIGIQVEEQDRAVEVSLDGLPFTKAGIPFSSLLIEFPVEVIMLRPLVAFPQERRQEADAIKIGDSTGPLKGSLA